MISKYKILIITFIFALVLLSLITFLSNGLIRVSSVYQDQTAKIITLSGRYVCLPLLVDASVPGTEECVFGFKTDDGYYYMVNFGQSASSKKQFDNGAYIKAEGFIVLKETLNTDQWNKYDMKGIFTITKTLP